jgi:hypothetical protein
LRYGNVEVNGGNVEVIGGNVVGFLHPEKHPVDFFQGVTSRNGLGHNSLGPKEYVGAQRCNCFEVFYVVPGISFSIQRQATCLFPLTSLYWGREKPVEHDCSNGHLSGYQKHYGTLPIFSDPLRTGAFNEHLRI